MNSGDKNETVDTPPLMRKGQIGDVDFDNIFKTAKSWSENPYKRSHALNRIWQNFPENDVGASYFKFYSDLITLSTDITKFQPAGLVLVKVDVNAPEFALCSVVAAAFAAGCPVIIETKTLFKCFSYLSEELGGMITITRNQVNVLSMANKERVGRVVFLGTWNGTELKETYTYTFPHCLVYSFTPGYTAAFLMEQCDINSAVDTILLHTWGKGFKSNTWAVRNVVVFENTYEKFLNILKFRLEKYFYMDYPESKMLVDDLKDFKKRAIKAGAEILENSNLQSESVWGPTVALEYQEQGEGPELTIKVVICRTANEGVNLLNNLQYSHGISIWTDISSQALEAASLLNCCNIWVNSHGVVSADTQLTISGKGGSLICGGTDGT
ncbi:hypothetical protein RUM43_005884 [Polyplax serrata]|uniref:Aldehyde dehydrogenase domain-containing protein n=1 Tax=Polyplax serrata TaxID=468196 RepID=A0AAN8S360_POLSC